MKLAIISLSTLGRNLAQDISRKLEGDHTVIKTDIFHKNVFITLKNIFDQYDCIVGVMASGIMVRSLCPLVKSKTYDPAVLVVDEKGKHVISLLSGHLGGGNDFTLKIARLIRADPVITTATDAQGKVGVDSLARKYYFYLDDPGKIMVINRALLEGKTVELALPNDFEYIFKDEMVKRSYKKILNTQDKHIKILFNKTNIILTPEKLVVGLGARKDVSVQSVLTAVKEALHTLNLPLERVDAVATAEPKSEEMGIIKAADILGRPLEIISLNRIMEFEHPDCSTSSLVKKTFGVGGICEPAALLAAGNNSHLLYRKKAYDKVTIAVAVSRTLYNDF